MDCYDIYVAKSLALIDHDTGFAIVKTKSHIKPLKQHNLTNVPMKEIRLRLLLRGFFSFLLTLALSDIFPHLPSPISVDLGGKIRDIFNHLWTLPSFLFNPLRSLTEVAHFVSLLSFSHFNRLIRYSLTS